MLKKGMFGYRVVNIACVVMVAIAVWACGALCAKELPIQKALLTKESLPIATDDIMETTPVIWQGRPVLFCSQRRGGAEHSPDMLRLLIVDRTTGEKLAELGTGHSLGCAFVETTSDGEIFHVFAAEQPVGESWFRDIDHFSSRDLTTWTHSTVVRNENEHLLNSSVCRDSTGYIMAYESDNPVGFCFKFARSADLDQWEKIPDLYYAGSDGKTYSACPVIRWHDPYYYVIYLRANGRGGYESAMIRSTDLQTWEESPSNPILVASEGEGINNSDVDLFEYDGKTELVYATGDQQTWCDVRCATFDGTEREFFEACFEPIPFAINRFTGDESPRTNIYVAKSGDDSDGKSWATAFHTIQQGLLAVPDDRGAYRVVVKPDTYHEANLYVTHKGAKNAYNEWIGDYDGRFGSGATGWVVVDSSDSTKGYQSYDWYSVIRAYQQGWSSEHTGETISSLNWDRWIVRNLYVTGSDAGLFWDCLVETSPFTLLVEDCVSFGRAFGIGVAFGGYDPATPHSRPDEPTVFRRTYAMTLDRWGDAGAAFLRAYNPTLPSHPDFFLEDCTLVSPDNAIENNCNEYDGSTYVSLKNCRLIVLNFTQPVGDPPCTGIIRSPNDGSRYRIDLEHCDLMGYKVFSHEKENPLQYSLRGRNRAYVQYTQTIPTGMEPFEGWPIDLIDQIAPPVSLPRSK